MTQETTRIKGFLMTLLGVLILSPDALLVRLVETDAWTLLFWRSLLSALAFAVLIPLAGRRLDEGAKRLGLSTLTVACLFAIANVLFILSLTATTAANTLLIIGTTPLFAALLSFFVYKEQLETRTALAIGGALCGILIIFAGDLGGGSLFGDVAAAAAAVAQAGAFVAIRHHTSVSAPTALGLGLLMAAIFTLPLAAPLSVPAESYAPLAIMGLAVLPVSFLLITQGPKHIQAAEVGLIMLLETILGPLMVWAVLSEVPANTTFLGGALVFGTLLAHALADLRKA